MIMLLRIILQCMILILRIICKRKKIILKIMKIIIIITGLSDHEDESKKLQVFTNYENNYYEDGNG